MKKVITTLLIVLIFSTMIIGCNIKKVKTTDNTQKSNVEETNNNELNLSSISVNKDSDLKVSSQKLFEKYLDYYKGNPKDKSLKLKEYKIEKITILKSKDDFIDFQCTYSLNPEDQDAWLIGNGKKEDNGWITSKVAFVDADIKDGKVILKSIATSPNN